MKLESVNVQMFRNIVNSDDVAIEPDITCLVGKNESGKTAFLEALYRLMPSRDNVSLNVREQYPAWREKRDRQSKELEAVTPIAAVFSFEDNNDVLEVFGRKTFPSCKLVLKRKYGGGLIYTLPTLDEKSFVEHIVSQQQLPHGTKTRAKAIKKIKDVIEYAKELQDESEEGDRLKLGRELQAQLDGTLGGKSLQEAVWQFLKAKTPRFLYFSKYSQLPYSIDINHVLSSRSSELSDSELTARSLLRLGGADNDYLVNPDYELRKRELENVSNQLSSDMRRYWSQNRDLRMQPDITSKTVPIQPPQQGSQSVLDELKLRVWDDRHQLSLPFDEHSSGFRWFFSFLAAFSEYENTEAPVILLLDEPALGLHAKAQADFLRYIEERLARRCQVIYTTHSPFMVQPGKLERVRLVEDKTASGDLEPQGALITSDVNSTDEETLFPLQAALGYDLAQHLFIGHHNLVVEGTSDYTYLSVVSDYLRDLDEQRTTLDERWSIIPVGGADLVPTFVALLGNHLDVTVLVDARKKGHQRLSHLASEGLLHQKRILTISAVVDKKEADIEDVFTIDDYLSLYNRTFGRTITATDLQGADPIVRQIARKERVDRFDHGRPADVLLRHRDEILPQLSSATLRQFESLFEIINDTLEE